ncbi:MAG: hypothetical protein CMJ89_12235 [Planctomycetes bacterium]|nr:hypothetical protein [Planctomycetota bacterium]
MSTLELLRSAETIESIAHRLDALSHSDRVRELRALKARDLRALHELTAGRPAPLSHFVPPSVSDDVPVRHHGVNSLPFLRHFEKRFLRDADSGELWGYNHQTMRPVTGPGYFVVADPAPGEAAAIDYRRIPPRLPHESWPGLVSNERLPQRLVFGHMRDLMQLVSVHVSVGRAERKGKPAPAWFALVREDPLP